jgi:hypothetical protein
MNCKNCGKDINQKNEIFPKDAVDLINLHTKQDKDEYCVSCAKEIYKSALIWRDKRKLELSQLLYDMTSKLPNLNSIAPNNWEYDVIGIIVSRSVNPQFIFQNDEKVIINGINKCIGDLYIMAVNKGGNLIMNIDLDFLEVNKSGGFDKTIITATGTAIKLRNIDILAEKEKKALEDSIQFTKEIVDLNKYQTYKV